MANKQKFYVTTPIYYVTARPHLGSLYSTLLADVAARWHKLQGHDTYFLTGTDEHGQKIAEAAAKVGKEPKEFVDSFIEAYKDIWARYDIAYNHFIRTTDSSHVEAVQAWLKMLQDNGDIYKSLYTGWYCTPCETFITEKNLGELSAPACSSCNRATGYMEEECYFFRLSAYQDKLLKFYEQHPDFVTPSERLQEVISFVSSGLKDLSISRTTITWGIPFPGDTKHITYVWADALTNYITAIGWGDSKRQAEFDYWWPADMQVMGKDIIRFHAVYWPAFLMASKLAQPKKLLVHGWLKVNNQKMSKSFGNIVDPQELLTTYGSDAVRYYLVRHMAITQDAEFSTADLEARINADLANDLGNLLNRVVTLAHKHAFETVRAPQAWGVQERQLHDQFNHMLDSFIVDMNTGYFYRAYSSLWKYINSVNAYFHAQEPWKVAHDKDRFGQILAATVHGLYGIAVLALPVMPRKMAELLGSLSSTIEPGADTITLLRVSSWANTFVLQKIPTLFAKYEAPVKTAETKQSTAPVAAQDAQTVAADIAIEDFGKAMLVVGTIEQCTEIPKSDRLLQLQVNFGPLGMRQILSGIKKYYTPADLLGKQAVFIYNLAPRTMMGLVSHGMLLATGDDKPVPVMPAEPVPNGSRLR